MASDPTPPSGIPARGGAVRTTSGAATSQTTWNGVDAWTTMSVQLVAAIGIWAGAGYWLDSRLGTGPLLLGLGTLVGFAAGLYLLWLRTEAGIASRERRIARGQAAGTEPSVTSEGPTS